AQVGLPERAVVNRNIVAIGTSAGGVEALKFLAGRFPANFPASVFVTLHLSSAYRSEMDTILDRAGPLRASFAVDGEPIENGRIYIAPTDRHLIVGEHRIALGRGPRENNARPAIDPMFRSAALCCGYRSIGVVLTGSLSDGASGLFSVKHCGG